jgi:hypothetical protein
MNNDYREEREPLNTKSMLEEGFFANLSNKSKQKIAKSETVEQVEIPQVQNKINTEKLLLDLYEMRDEMIDSAKELGLGSKVASTLTKNINKIGTFIQSYGGKVEDFNPIDSISGLEEPDLSNNAERVIANTKRSYRLGKIGEAQISKNGKEIVMAFVGNTGEMGYKALGTISTKGVWMGSEAIDYVYTPGSGKMSVKALNNDGKWIDKSLDFNVSWELWENIDQPLEDKTGKEEIKTAGKEEEIIENKEEVKKDSQNNDIDEDIGDFPIEENNEGK